MPSDNAKHIYDLKRMWKVFASGGNIGGEFASKVIEAFKISLISEHWFIFVGRG